MNTDTITAPRFTAYSRETVGNGYHTVKAQFTGRDWILTLVHTPATIMAQPPTGEELAGSEWCQFVAAQSRQIACRRVDRQFIHGGIEVRPTIAAGEMVTQILGSAWTVLDLGKGYKVELR